MTFRAIALFIVSLLIPACYAQELLPFTENFTKSEYQGDNQVWNVVQGNDNAMYFANNHYFLRYNGVKWEKYGLPNKTIIRSVFVDGDKIYCGSYKEFGYWKRINGKMEYTSLSKGKNLFLGNADNEEIWKVFRHGNVLYFQSFNELYYVDGTKTGKIKFPSQISYCYVIDGSIYVASVRNGMYKFDGKSFTHIAGWPELNDNVVHGMEKYGGQVYIFTKYSGIYIVKDGKLTSWNNPLNFKLKNEVIITAKFAGDKLIVGTGLLGAYIIDIKSGNYKNINRSNSLKNNAVLSLAIDREKDLWLGLDNGIAHIELNSPVTLFTDNLGILGSVYSLAEKTAGYLFVTNHGIFSYNGALSAIPNTQGQVWDIYENNGNFIIGHNDGTFVYDGQSVRKVNPVNGGWKFLKSNYEDVYFQANYSGIAVYKNINDLSKWTILDSITKPIRNIAQNRPGELWAADNYRSLYRIKYDSNFKVQRVENISSLNKINSDYGVKLFNYRNEILFLINSKWYYYNNVSDKLEENVLFNKAFNNISDIIPVDEDNFMVIRNGLLYSILQNNNDFIWKLVPEKYYHGRLIMENTKAYKSGNSLLINLDDGFMKLNPYIQKMNPGNISIEAYFKETKIDEDTKIAYNNSLEINLISGFYGYSKPDLYYRLNDSGKFIPIRNGLIVLNNLTGGHQKFDVYYFNGKDYDLLKTFTFNVARPWYFSWYMILAYMVIIASSFFLYYRWNKVRYLEKLRLSEEELKHRRQILELELETESRLRQEQYEKHVLEMEVQNKASEVAGKSLSIAKHSEMIENIQAVLDAENEVADLKAKIKKIIKTNSISKNEWQSFEKNLIKSHEEFVEKLSKKYPSLTPKDIKLSIYLKMNLSSKEIAPLMNISFRGVELHRYRLRKKLEIPQEVSLSRFMISI
jgi:AraC family transcriptional regulator, chitin signaling transcriptional activator